MTTTKKLLDVEGSPKASSDTLTDKVDQIVDLLQDMLVLQAASVGATNEEIRKAFRLDMNRVSRISRLARKSE